MIFSCFSKYLDFFIFFSIHMGAYPKNYHCCNRRFLRQRYKYLIKNPSPKPQPKQDILQPRKLKIQATMISKGHKYNNRTESLVASHLNGFPMGLRSSHCRKQLNLICLIWTRMLGILAEHILLFSVLLQKRLNRIKMIGFTMGKKQPQRRV